MNSIPQLPTLLPSSLKEVTPNNSTPWKISTELFSRITNSNEPKNSYHKEIVPPTDPEWRFVWKYFSHDLPNRYMIKSISCVHNREQTRAFEAQLVKQDKEVSKFPPDWNQKPNSDLRETAIQRWKSSAELFSPVMNRESNRLDHVKILPLWHGTSKERGDSICDSGFIFFGVKSLADGQNKPNVDPGFFGNGIYFTNSGRYAADIYSKGGVLLLSWVSMREPFPVVEGDRKGLQGNNAFDKYNAHYIPVRGVNSANIFESDYDLCKRGQEPHCDEIVVFQSAQTLPRFWIELEPIGLYLQTITKRPTIAEDLVSHLFKIMQHPEIDAEIRVRVIFSSFLARLLQQDAKWHLNSEQIQFYEKIYNLIDTSGRINNSVRAALLQSIGLIPVTPHVNREARSPNIENTVVQNRTAEAIDLVAQKINEENYPEAISLLLLRMADTQDEKPEQVYSHLHTLLHHFNLQQWKKLRGPNHLFPFLQRTPSYEEQQGILATDIAYWIEHFVTNNTLTGIEQRSYLAEAMHFYAQAGKLKALAEKGDRECSHLLFQSFVILQLARTKERFIKATEINYPTDFRKELERLFGLRKFCCFEDAFSKLHELHVEVSDLISSIPGNVGDFPALLYAEMQIASTPSTLVTQKYKKSLEDWRSAFATTNLSQEQIRPFQKTTFEKFQNFFSVLLNDAICLAGPVPGPYDIRAMGSFGRKEPDPFSALELIVFYQDENHKEYFEQLVFFLNLQIHSLGEVKYPFYFTNLKEFSGFYLQKVEFFTPKAIAVIQSTLTKNAISVNATLESTSLISSDGGKLYTSYQEEIEKNWGSVRKKRALQLLGARLKDYQSRWLKNLQDKPIFPTRVNLKEDYVELLNYTLSDLSLYFGIQETNTLDIIDQLKEENVFTEQSTRLLKECVATLYTTRIRLHLLYGEQKEEAYFEKERVGSLLPEEKKMLKKSFWLVLFPLYARLEKGINCESESFASHFKEVDLIDIAFHEIKDYSGCDYTVLVSLIAQETDKHVD